MKILPTFSLNWWSSLTAGAGGVFVFLWGGWTPTLEFLLTMCLLDWLSGVGAAWVNHELCSRSGLTGFLRKVGLWAMIAVAHVTIRTLGGEHLGGLTTSMLCTVLGLNEAFSVLENLVKMGVPVPEGILKRFRRARDFIGAELEK